MLSRWLSLARSKSLTLLGPRRSGKTTLLKTLFPDFHYITLDDFDALELAQTDPKALVANHKLLIIDEVQRVPKLLIAAKYAIDELGATILMTGSSSIGLDSAGAETLAGRIQRLELPTFCWGEDKGVATHTLEQTPPALQLPKAMRLLDAAMQWGGFPEVICAETGEQKLAILKNYRDSYFTKDLLLLSNLEKADALVAILHYIARSIGSPFEPSNAAREAGVSFQTAKKYLNVLIASRLVFRVYGYHYGPAKRFTRATKYYFSDMGIPTAIGASLSEGQRFENFCIGEFEKQRRLGIIDTDRLYYYRTSSGAEIDLLIETPNHLQLFEIKSKVSITRSDTRTLRSFTTDKQTKLTKNLIYRGKKSYIEDEVRSLPISHLYRCHLGAIE